MFKSVFNFRGTTIFRAFLINSIIIGIVAALTIEARRQLNEEKYKYLLPHEYHKVLVTMLISTLVSMIAFMLMRYLFGTYAGVLDGKRLSYFI